jgi:hypothetical protein
MRVRKRRDGCTVEEKKEDGGGNKRWKISKIYLTNIS